LVRTGSRITINGSEFKTTDILVTNGIVHIVSDLFTVPSGSRPPSPGSRPVRPKPAPAKKKPVPRPTYPRVREPSVPNLMNKGRYHYMGRKSRKYKPANKGKGQEMGKMKSKKKKRKRKKRSAPNVFRGKRARLSV